jgi:hypothetical protein
MQAPYELIWQILVGLGGTIAGAAAVYGGIRMDLKGIHERIARNETFALRAHERLDRHVETFHTRRGDT